MTMPFKLRLLSTATRIALPVAGLFAAFSGGAQAKQAAVPEGFVSATSLDGVAGVAQQADGSLRLTLEDGSTVTVPAGDVQVVDGIIYVSDTALEALGIGTGASASGTGLLIGAGAVVAGGAAAASSGGGGSTPPPPPPPPPPPNSAPTFTSDAAVDVAENLTAAYTAAATDAEGDALTYSISGGADAALFSIDANTGEVTFNTAPDFEAPDDDDADNVYEIEVAVSDGTNTTTQTVTLTVTNENDNAPAFTSSATVQAAENQTAAITAAATDADGDTVTYAITGGADAALFSIDATTGEVVFNTAPDFEAPGDADSDNAYEIEITASDGTNTTAQAVTITVTNENDNAPVLTSAATADVAENLTAAYTATATDADGDALTYSITGGADAALFTIDANTGAVSFNAAPDFEAPGDADSDNAYEIEVTASDGTSRVAQTVTLTVTNENDNAPAFTSSATAQAAENQTAAITAAATDADGDTVTYAITGGADAALFSIDATTGEVVFNTAPDFEAPGDADSDNAYEIEITASDGTNTTAQAVTITVTNENDNAPVLTSAVTADVAENLTAAYTATATDADGDALTYSITGGADAALFSIDANTGAVSFNAAADFELPSDENGDGQYVIEVTASDGVTSVAQTVTLTVTDANDAPVAAQDVAVSSEDGSVTFDILGNDSDQDGDPVSLVSVAGQVLTAGESVLLASGALVRLNVDGTLTYTPGSAFQALNAGDSDQDVFTYQVSDGNGGVSDGQVTVLIAGEDEPPTVITQLTQTNPGDPPAATGTDGVQDTIDVGDLANADGAEISNLEAGDEIILSNVPNDFTLSNVGFASGSIQFQVDLDGDGIVDGTFSLEGEFDNGDFNGLIIRPQINQDGTVTFVIASLPAGSASITGSNDGEVISGTSADDLIYGLGGDDLLAGNGGDDEIYGGDGDDEILGGLGINALYGGAGDDTITDIGNSLGYGGEGDDTITMADGNAIGGAGSDTIIATGSRGVTLVGAGGLDYDAFTDTTYRTGAGDGGAVDTLIGGDGNDNLLIGLNDIADGGAGSDRLYVSFVDAQQGVNLDLRSGDAFQIITAAANATVSNVERINALYGSDFDDTIHAGADAATPSTIRGGAGDDIITSLRTATLITGGEGNDTIDVSGIVNPLFTWLGGGAGDDVIIGSSADDRISPSGEFSVFGFVAGNDTVDGGDGFDTVEYFADFGRPFTADLTIDLAVTTQQDIGFGTLTISNVEKLITGSGDDRLSASNTGSHLFSHDGNDVLIGRDGADRLEAGDGDDVLEGGAGIDVLIGGDGDDTLTGGLGADSLTGGAGRDSFVYRSAAEMDGDTIFDFDDEDRIDLSQVTGQNGEPLQFIGSSDFDPGLTGGSSAGQVRVSPIGGQTLIEIDTDGDALGDIRLVIDTPVTLVVDANAPGFVLVVERNEISGTADNDEIDGTQNSDSIAGLAGDDILNGLDGNDDLFGGPGFDLLSGEEGNDRLFGGDGDDLLEGGVGTDLMTGGAGSDRFKIAGSDLVGTGERITDFAAGDLLDMNLIATDAMATEGVSHISFVGSAEFSGVAGEVRVSTRNGVTRLEIDRDGDRFADDVLELTNGAALEEMAPGSLQFILVGLGAQTLTGTDGRDRLVGSNADDILDGGAGADELYGASGNDTLLGGDGDDRLNPGMGIDTVDGGAGTDSVVYSFGELGLDSFVLEVTDTGFSLDGVARDRWSNVEALDFFAGSAESDIMDASAVTNLDVSLSGFAGIDRLIGGAGDDTLHGGTGIDVMAGGAGADKFEWLRAEELEDGDFVMDFSVADGDTLDVRQIGVSNAPEFGFEFNRFNDLLFLGTGQFTGQRGVYRYEQVNGDTVVSFDLDGDRQADGSITLVGFANVLFEEGPGVLRGAEDLRLDGTEGDDTLIGGAGSDILNGLGGNDIIRGGANLDLLIGGSGDDDIDGGEGRDVLQGGSGNDTLEGGTEADVLYGDAGNDILIDVDGDGYLMGGSGDDTITGAKTSIMMGGDGSDTLTVTEEGLNTRTWFFGAGGFLDEDGNPVPDGQLLTNFERFDYKRGDGGAVDIMTGGSGVDHFWAGLNDVVDGGGDTDRFYAVFTDADQALNLDLSGVNRFGLVAAVAAELNATVSNVEELVTIYGSRFDDVVTIDFGIRVEGGDGNDQLTTLGGLSTLTGNAGDDVIDASAVFNGTTYLAGGAGNDTIIGSEGRDFIEPGGNFDEFGHFTGDDIVDGRGGYDFLKYAGEFGVNSVQADLTIDLEITTQQDTGFGLLTVTNVEGIYSGDGNDTLFAISGGLGSTFYSYGGDDVLIGRSAGDTFYAGDGNDTLIGGAGSDFLFGEAGDDVIEGGDAFDRLDGGDGNDLLRPGSGNDTVVGGAGIDRVVYEAGDFGLLPLALTVTDSLVVQLVQFDTLNSVEQLDFFAATDGDDTIDASQVQLMTLHIRSRDGNDTVTGGALNDVIEAGAGSDTVDGGDGTDTLILDFNHLPWTNILVTQSSVTDSVSGETNTVSNIEVFTITGSGGGDRIEVDLAAGSANLVTTAGPDFYVLTNGETTIRVVDLTGQNIADTITGFGTDDRLDFSNVALPAGASLSFIGEAEFSGVAGELRYEKTGGQTLVYIDIDGDRVADGSYFLTDGEFDLVEGTQAGVLVRASSTTVSNAAFGEPLVLDASFSGAQPEPAFTQSVDFEPGVDGIFGVAEPLGDLIALGDTQAPPASDASVGEPVVLSVDAAEAHPRAIGGQGGGGDGGLETGALDLAGSAEPLDDLIGFVDPQLLDLPQDSDLRMALDRGDLSNLREGLRVLTEEAENAEDIIVDDAVTFGVIDELIAANAVTYVEAISVASQASVVADLSDSPDGMDPELHHERIEEAAFLDG